MPRKYGFRIAFSETGKSWAQSVSSALCVKPKARKDKNQVRAPTARRIRAEKMSSVTSHGQFSRSVKTLGGLAESWVELGTERESLLQVLDENANFGGQPAAGRPYGEDWHGSLKGS
jgi:hypothetical protein